MDLLQYIIPKHPTKVNFTQLVKISIINNQVKLSQFTECLKINNTHQDKLLSSVMKLQNVSSL